MDCMIHSNMKPFLMRWLVTTIAVWVAATLVSGVDADNTLALLGASLFLGIVNALIRPVLLLLSVPFILLTMGLFILVVNALMFWLVGGVVPGFEVEGFWSAFWGGLCVSVVSWALNSFFRTSDGRIHAITHHEGSAGMKRVEGKVIDV